MKTIDIGNLVLARGSHADFGEGACVMEAVSMLSGEPWSDRPSCACPTITEFLIKWNDDLLDDERQMLKQFVPLGMPLGMPLGVPLGMPLGMPLGVRYTRQRNISSNPRSNSSIA